MSVLPKLIVYRVTFLFAYVPGVIMFSAKEGRYVAFGIQMDEQMDDTAPNQTGDVPAESANNGMLSQMSSVRWCCFTWHSVQNNVAESTHLRAA